MSGSRENIRIQETELKAVSFQLSAIRKKAEDRSQESEYRAISFQLSAIRVLSWIVVRRSGIAKKCCVMSGKSSEQGVGALNRRFSDKVISGTCKAKAGKRCQESGFRGQQIKDRQKVKGSR
jgi:hypothetical protein